MVLEREQMARSASNELSARCLVARFYRSQRKTRGETSRLQLFGTLRGICFAPRDVMC